MIENGVPRSYLIKQCRNDLNKLCHVTSTPGTFEGAQIPFKSILCQQISAFKQENPDFDFDNETLKIKISGDGAKMTQKTDYILHPYHIFSQGNTHYSSIENMGITHKERSSESFRQLLQRIPYLETAWSTALDYYSPPIFSFDHCRHEFFYNEGV